MPKKEPKKVEEEESEVTCPVCGKPVGLTVPSCPYCGAEFEEEEVEEVEEAEEEESEQEEETPEPAKAKPAEPEEEMAECPVCGAMVSLTVSSCPSCGAEFEEEEVEEIVEVEEKTVPVPKKKAEAKASEKAHAEAEEAAIPGAPSSIADLRVIGIALIILGIIGSQIAFMIDWYWSWVPPIEDNLGLFVAIPAAVIVVGLLVFMLIKKLAGEGKKVPSMVPGLSLSIFLFGILGLVLIMLWDPINSALQKSNAGVGGAFVAVLIVGALVMVMGNKMVTKRAS